VPSSDDIQLLGMRWETCGPGPHKPEKIFVVVVVHVELEGGSGMSMMGPILLFNPEK
jgi:hypothetical protein